jgi:hypothetical protein
MLRKFHRSCCIFLLLLSKISGIHHFLLGWKANREGLLIFIFNVTNFSIRKVSS